ncbi:hypothetical protein [Armatimonas sp.]|nr:hypothetical protein [Armatimonas sp.]
MGEGWVGEGKLLLCRFRRCTRTDSVARPVARGKLLRRTKLFRDNNLTP